MRRTAPLALALFPVLAVSLLAGCENPRAQSAAAAQQNLVGMSKSALLQCAGAPSLSAAADGIEVLTYDTVRLQADRSHPAFGGHLGRGWGVGAAWADAGGTQSRTCRASFTIQGGKVSKVVYGSPDSTGDGRLDQCFAVIENCVPPPAK